MNTVDPTYLTPFRISLDTDLQEEQHFPAGVTWTVYLGSWKLTVEPFGDNNFCSSKSSDFFHICDYTRNSALLRYTF